MLVGVNERGLRVGEDHQRAVLLNADIENMLELRRGGMPLKEIAEKFDCSISHTSRVCGGLKRAQFPAHWRMVKTA